MQHYADVKERLVAGSDTAVVGVDDTYCTLIADRLQRRRNGVSIIGASDAPPSALPGISPSRGEIGIIDAAASDTTVASAAMENGKRTEASVISPLEGEMSGRTEGGNATHRVIRISQDTHLQDGFFNSGHQIFYGETLIADLNGISTLRGSHNAQNAAAAIAACRAVGVSSDEIRAGLASFPGLKHRMQPVARAGRVTFVNDSKATNAEAAAPALSSYERIFWIAGGLPKAGGIASLAPLFARIVKAYLIGEAAPEFAATLGEAVPFEISGTLDRAVAHAASGAAADGGEAAVMLSPACASFDQFRNFEIRGETFVSLVAELDGVTMLVEPEKGK
jgi:UDP-N-acetylmuramoylalanine--D-glutamate ligase